LRYAPAVFLLLAIVAFLLGWRAARRLYSRLWAPAVWGLAILTVGMDFYVGRELWGANHLNLDTLCRSAGQALPFLGTNMTISFVATALILLLARPWRVVQEAGLLRTLSFSLAVMLANYIFASIVYGSVASFLPD
jgi:hypothetical protein